MTPLLRNALRLLALPFLLTSALSASTDFRILFDTDNNPATGCAVSGMNGVERVVTTTLDTSGSTPRVSLVQFQRCSGGTLGAPVALETLGWPAGFDATTGIYTVETRVLDSVFGDPVPTRMRLGFVAVSGSQTATVLMDDDGNSFLFPQTPVRRRAVGTPGHTFVLDGLIGDWMAMPPLAFGDSDNGPNLARFLGIFAGAGADGFYFRFDFQSHSGAPTARNDSYSTPAGTPLSVTAPGVMSNDTDPNNRALTAALVSSVSRGALVLNSDGSFTYTPADGGTFRDTFRYHVSNGSQPSNVARVEIHVGRSNHPPNAGDDTYNVVKGGSINAAAPGVLGNDNDPDGDALHAVLRSSPSHGTLTFNSDGSFIYFNDGLSTANDSFTYVANDGQDDSREATVHINVTTNPNAPPHANSDAYTVDEGGTLNVPAPGVLTNDTDPDTPASSLSVFLVAHPAHGAVTLSSNGGFVYIHDGSETTSDSFTYRAFDGATSSNIATVTITINPVNDAPIASNDTYTTAEDTPLTVPAATGVLANDTDSDTPHAALVATMITNAANGNVVLSASGSFTYTPNANFFGTDSFTYTAGDGSLSSPPATVTITVTPVNDPPSFAVGGNVTVLEDSGAYSAAQATAISPGPGEAEAVSFGVTNNNNGLFSAQPAISPAGVLTFTPAPDASGTATVTVILNDAGTPPLSSAAQTFTITVTAVNDPPAFNVGGNVTVLEDSGAYSAGQATAISPGPSDEAGQTVSFGVTNNNNALFSAQPAISPAGVLTFTPAANASGTATVTVIATDNGAPPASSAAQTFTVTVTAVNDVPTFNAGGNVTVNEDSGAYSAVQATAISAGPADEAGQTLNFIVSNDNNALFTAQPAISPAGVLTFTPAPDATGTATVTVSLHDNGGTANGGVDTSGTQTFTITVTAVNDSPSFNGGGNVTVLEDSGAYSAAQATAISPGPADEAGQTVSFNVSNDNNALFSVQPAISPAGVLTFTLAADANGAAAVTVTAADNGVPPATSTPQTFTITVTPVNDAPSFTKGPDVTVNEDTPFNAAWATAISAGPNEAGQVVNFIVSNNNNALFSVQPAVSAAGVLTFTPAPDASGSAIVTIQIHDDGLTLNGGVDTSAAQTFNITVTAVNDPPSFNGGGNVTVLEDSGAYSAAQVSAISPGPPDEAGQTVSFNVSNNNNALFSVQPAISPAGVLTFTLAADANGPATVTVTATDNGVPPATSAPQTFTLTVTPVNDVPSFTKGPDVTVNEDTPFNAAWATAISAGPNEAGQVVNFIVSNNNNALFSVQPSVSPAGVLTFTPAPNASGSALATIQIHDDGLTLNGGVDTSAAQTFNINVTAVNDPPSFNAGGNVTVLEDSGAYSAAQVSAISPGPADEAGQTVTFNVSNDNNALFSVQPAISAAGVLTFTLVAEANGSATVTVTATDNGVPPATSAPQTFTITVNAVNDAPVNIMPAPQTMSQNSTLTLSGVGAIQTSDIDAGGNAVQGALIATNGTMTLNGTAGLSFTVGDGTADGSMTFTGTIAAINTALNGLQFTSTPGFFGPASIQITTDDQGFTGIGGPLQDTDTLAINVIEVNQAPVNVVPGPQSVNEDATLTFSTGNGNAISTSDVDAGAGIVQITLSVGSGALTLVPTAGVTINNNGTSNVTATGTITDLNTALNGLTYAPVANFNGPITLTFTTDDQGNTGPGGPQSDTDTVAITVTPVNDPPVLTAGGTLSYTEDQVATAIDTTVTVTDSDSNIVSATVQITTGYVNGEDVLSFTNTVNITGSFVAGTGTLTLTGSDTPANYETALRAVRYNNANTANPATAARTVTWTVNDGLVNSNSPTSTINVTAVNDAPVVTAGATLAYTENDPASVIDNTITVSAVDSPNLVGATVTISGNFASGEDVLSFATIGPISGSYAAGTGILTLSGTDTLGNYQAALRTVTYNNTSENPSALTRTVTWVGNDGAGLNNLSAGVTSTITVTAVNDAPVVTAGGTLGYTENAAATNIDGTITVADVDSVNLTGATVQITANYASGDDVLSYTTALGISGTFNAGTGTLTLTGTATLANYETALRNVKYNNTSENPTTAPRNVTWIVNDGGAANNLSAPVTSTINVTAVNDPPVVPVRNFNAQANMKISYSGLLAGVTDADNGVNGCTATPFSLASVTVNSCAGCVISNINAVAGSFDFEPPAGQTGSFTLNYTVSDNGCPGTATSAATAINITVAGPVIWFVDNALGSDLNNGTLAHPFKTLAAADAVDAVNHGIFVYSGTYANGIALNSGETMIGQGCNPCTFDGIFAISPPAGTMARPTLNGTSPILQGTVTAASSSFVRGLDISTTGVTGYFASGVASFVVSQVSVTSTGNAVTIANATTSLFTLTSTTSSGGANGISLTNASGTYTFGTGSLTGNTTAGFSSATGNAAMTVTYGGSITNNTARIALINNGAPGACGTITLSGNLSASAGTGILVNNCNSGTINFSGGSKSISTGGNPAVSLTNNGGATMNFTGGALAITTTSGSGFSATGGGTVNVTGVANTISSGTGTALNVANTNIGASGLTFQSISANGGANGIFLQNTGASGGLTVTGDGVNTLRGGNASGGTIQNMAGADGATAGNGIYLDNTQKVSLRRMQLNGFQNSAIRGFTVTDFTLQYSTINGTSGNNTGATEGAVTFGDIIPASTGLAGGTNLIDNCRISGAIEHNVEFYNYLAASNYSLTVSNSDIKSNSVAGGSDGIQMELGGAYANTATVSIQSCSFDDNKSQGIQGTALASSTLDITINNCTLVRTTQGNEGFILANGANGHLTAHVTNNNLSGIGGVAIFVGQVPGNASASSNLIAVIQGNTVVHPTTATNHAIIAFLTSTTGQTAPANILIQSNNVTENSTGGVSRAILVDTPDPGRTPSFTASVLSNTVSVGDNIAGVTPIAVQARNGSTGCFDIRSNVATFPNGQPAGIVGVRARQATLATANLEQGASGSAIVATVLSDNNLSANGTEVLGTVGVVPNNTCAAPPP